MAATKLPLEHFIGTHWETVSAGLQLYAALYVAYLAANVMGAMQIRRYKGVVWRTSGQALPMLRIAFVALLAAAAAGSAGLWLAAWAASQEMPSSAALRLLFYGGLGGSLAAALPLGVLAGVQGLTVFNIMARSRGREEKFCFLFSLWLEPEFAVILQAMTCIGFVVALTMCWVAHFSSTAHRNSF